MRPGRRFKQRAEMPRQMTLIGETEIIRDLGDAAALSNPASCFLESQAQKIAVGRQSRRGLELADKLIATQAGKSRQGVKSGIIAQTRFHEIRDLCQSLPRQLARCLFARSGPWRSSYRNVRKSR